MQHESAFPWFDDHQKCGTMTELVLAQLTGTGGVGVAHLYARGEHVWERGDPADSIYFLKRGQVAVKKGTGGEDGVIVRVIESGELFGALCFCTDKGGKRPTVARAVVESEVVRVSLNDFLLFLRQSREGMALLLHNFCVRVADAERRIEMLSYRSADARLCHLLLHLASTRGRPVEADGDDRLVDVTHEELAGIAAMNRSHLTLSMGKLRKQGLVSYGRREPLVVHVRALSTYCSEKIPE